MLSVAALRNKRLVASILRGEREYVAGRKRECNDS